ncbi:MAG: class I SAM-dependent methyltransferase [Acidobacteria bacterium]|nr:class I SAM-dependent methyltransferase [Acidobacteriota bacterium]
MQEISKSSAKPFKQSTSATDSLFRRLFLRSMEALRTGKIVFSEGDRTFHFGTENGSPAATVQILDLRFYRQVALNGSLGAAESYIRGYWQCDDLVNLVRIFCRNAAIASKMEKGAARIWSLLKIAAHRMRRNTLRGSRHNIADHYDLGNDFFALFLDPTLAYSCAIFPERESTLHQAAIAKFDRICRKLDLKEKDHVLEIGSGWGGFALHAAGRYGCRVTTTTISRRQYEFVKKQVEDGGMARSIQVLLEDYRKLRGRYNKIVSIEMIEAVGYEYFDTYFRKCSALLESGGLMLLQAIIFPDQDYERYRRSVDFIQKYIFPGGCLPSLWAICRSVGRTTDLRFLDLEDITRHYPETLARWRQNFHSNIEGIRALGFTEEFIRTWHYYFCYCEGGFRERAIGDIQIILAKPGFREESTLLSVDGI